MRALLLVALLSVTPRARAESDELKTEKLLRRAEVERILDEAAEQVLTELKEKLDRLRSQQDSQKIEIAFLEKEITETTANFRDLEKNWIEAANSAAELDDELRRLSAEELYNNEQAGIFMPYFDAVLHEAFNPLKLTKDVCRSLGVGEGKLRKLDLAVKWTLNPLGKTMPHLMRLMHVQKKIARFLNTAANVPYNAAVVQKDIAEAVAKDAIRTPQQGYDLVRTGDVEAFLSKKMNVPLEPFLNSDLWKSVTENFRPLIEGQLSEAGGLSIVPEGPARGDEVLYVNGIGNTCESASRQAEALANISQRKTALICSPTHGTANDLTAALRDFTWPLLVGSVGAAVKESIDPLNRSLKKLAKGRPDQALIKLGGTLTKAVLTTLSQPDRVTRNITHYLLSLPEGQHVVVVTHSRGGIQFRNALIAAVMLGYNYENLSWISLASFNNVDLIIRPRRYRPLGNYGDLTRLIRDRNNALPSLVLPEHEEKNADTDNGHSFDDHLHLLTPNMLSDRW